MYGGYGHGIPPTGYGNPMGLGGGYGHPMGPMALQGRYMFNRQMIDMQAASTFMKYDFSRNGVLGYNEVRMALNEFCLTNGQMPVMEHDLMMLFRLFDIDGSGQLDFFEYKMLLEQLGGMNAYDRNMLMGFRAQRAMRMNQYMGLW